MDVRLNVYLVVGLLLCVCLSFVYSVSSVDSVSPFYYEFVDIPDNSFGVKDYWEKSINWTFFKECDFL